MARPRYHTENEPSRCTPPRPGMAWVWNKRETPFEFLADHEAFLVPGLTAMEVPADAAVLGRRHSVERLHPEVIRSLAVRWPEDYGEPDDADFGDILTEPRGRELYDRKADPNPMNIAPGDGVRTHAAEVSVAGAAASLRGPHVNPLG